MEKFYSIEFPIKNPFSGILWGYKIIHLGWNKISVRTEVLMHAAYEEVLDCIEREKHVYL